MKSLRMLAYRLNYVAAPRLNHKKPIDVSLELSSVCDMKCAYCYHNSPNVPFEKGFMDEQLAYKILFQSAELGVNSVKFNYRGEATLNPKFKEIAGLAKRLARGSTFIDRLTNSNFKFAPRRREEIFDGLACMSKVKVSYDSFEKDVFETQRSGGNHDLTTENIDLFYNFQDRIKSETQLVIQAVRTNLNKGEDIVGNAKRRWPDAEVSVRDMVTGRIDKDLSVFQNRERSKERQSCIQAHARMIVHHDGRVSPCCPAIKNNLLIGDLNKQTVSEVFNSIEAKRLRQSLKDKTAFFKDPCKTCPSFESFKGYKAPWNS